MPSRRPANKTSTAVALALAGAEFVITFLRPFAVERLPVLFEREDHAGAVPVLGRFGQKIAEIRIAELDRNDVRRAVLRRELDFEIVPRRIVAHARGDRGVV